MTGCSLAVRLVALLLSLIAFASSASPLGKRDNRPNILFILVDDQDFLLDSYKHMDILQSELVQKGTLFTKHYGHVSKTHWMNAYQCEESADRFSYRY
jgi:hypothetical protein